jgi:FkbM family methyltransferase
VRLPGPLRGAVTRAVAYTSLSDERTTSREIVRLRSIGEHASEGEKTIDLVIRPLASRTVRVREGTADIDTLWDVFVHRYHLPPNRVQRHGLRLIWDLGANIGLTMADMANRFEHVRVFGVELDSDNVAIARRNLTDFDDRVTLYEAAAWPEDGETWYHRWPGATSAYSAHAPTPGEEPQGPVVPTLSLDTLLERSGGPVDYVKMDVEGAERELLSQNTGWAEHVWSIKVEVHGDYGVKDCAHDLEVLGFETKVDRRHSHAVVGIREDRPS